MIRSAASLALCLFSSDAGASFIDENFQRMVINSAPSRFNVFTETYDQGRPAMHEEPSDCKHSLD